MEDLRTALTQTSVNAAKGNFDGPQQDYQIDANDQLVDQRRLPERCGCLSQRRAGPAERCCQHREWRRKHKASGMDERDAGGDSECPAPAGREHHQRGQEH